MELPKIYQFFISQRKEIMLNRNFKRVNDEIDNLIAELSGKETGKE